VLEALGAPLSVLESSGGEALSRRELEVLTVMAEGLANRDIARRLFVSEATVKTHVQRIMRKFDGKTRTEAVARAGTEAFANLRFWGPYLARAQGGMTSL
jgi:DNA-binding NarL/FixJ family response regulator